MYERGWLIGGKDRQAPVDESIMPMPAGPGYITTTWDQTGLTWADIIEQENENGTQVYRDRQLHLR